MFLCLPPMGYGILIHGWTYSELWKIFIGDEEG
jgi:hypothetical protein